MSEPKKRGRKPIAEGGKASPRKVLVTCAAMVNGEMVIDTVWCTNATPESTDNAILSEASAKFQLSHSIPDGTKIIQEGPFYPRIGVLAKQGDARPRTTIQVDLDNAELKPAGSATYKEWYVSVKDIVGQDEVAYIIFKAHVSGEKKSVPSARAVLKEELKDFQAIA